MKKLGFSLMLLVAWVMPVLAQSPTYEIRDLEIDLGDDFVTQAQLTYPSEGEAPFPTVILFHGSGPYDMDATYTTGDEPLSANFKLIAERLSEAGIAVLRFNKRGVLGNSEYDMAQVQASTLDRLVADANAVINAALEQPEVNPEALYLYGWSEGAWVAANAAVAHPEIAGLILQGAPNDRIDKLLPYQHLEIGIPYLTDEIDANGDGALSLDEILTIPAGPIALMPAFYMFAFDSTPENPKLNTFVNTDGNDTIDIEGELRPAIEMFMGNYELYAPKVEASYLTGELILEANVPTLLLQGDLDGWVSVASAEAIAEAAPDLVTLNLYEGLGHALSITEIPAEDSFDVMADEPIADMIAWIVD